MCTLNRIGRYLHSPSSRHFGAALWLARRWGGTSRARVADVLTGHPETVRPDATVVQVATLMPALDVGVLPVW